MAEKNIKGVQPIKKLLKSDLVSSDSKARYLRIQRALLEKGVNDFTNKTRDFSRKLRQQIIANNKKIKAMAEIDKNVDDIGKLKEKINNIGEKYNLVNPYELLESHRIDKFLEMALNEGWAWEYKYDVRARKRTKIVYSKAQWERFQSCMADTIGVDPKEIESLAVTNHSQKFIPSSPDDDYLGKDINIKDFMFQKSDNKKSLYIYSFMKVKGHWYYYRNINKLVFCENSKITRKEAAKYVIDEFMAGVYRMSDVARNFGFQPKLDLQNAEKINSINPDSDEFRYFMFRFNLKKDDLRRYAQQVIEQNSK